jgi:hypothetical protein
MTSVESTHMFREAQAAATAVRALLEVPAPIERIGARTCKITETL